VTFIAVGDGETLPEIRARVSELCRTKILFTGWQPEVESIMQACDIGVLATNADLHGEGIPNSVLEFMAVGRPVIATDAGGTRELLDDGRTGWLVANGNDASMAEKILALLDDPAKAHEMGECARERVRSEFSIEAMAREYRKLYERLLMDGKKPVEAA
jgi:glycosyltransferase involved in cell wall biosynthesis